MAYIWESQEWYRFKWDAEKLSDLMSEVVYEQGRILGQLEHLNLEHQNETQLQALTEDVLKSSEIEGEILPTDQVRSSVARRLGLDIGGLVASDKNIDGIVEVLIDASVNCMERLSKNRLLGWHAALFPTGYSGIHKITVGNWRLDDAGPMQVVSGGIGKEKVHFEAPAAKTIPDEMEEFLSWFDSSALRDGPVKAGLAHLWFVTIHPFEDGNGRIARALSDMVLSRSEKRGKRYYSMSSQIREERKQYYEILERTQKGWADVHQWLEWFLGCLHRSILTSNETVSAVMVRANFWQKFSQTPMNERQIKVLTKLLGNFEGKLTTSKWAKLAGCSQDSALRDIKDLVAHGALGQDEGGGRNTSYSLAPQ